MTSLILPRTFAGEKAVERGRDAAKRIADTVAECKARGRDVRAVRVSREVADAMVAFFCSWSRFDGVLPPKVHGVPFSVGDTGGRDFVFEFATGRHVEH